MTRNSTDPVVVTGLGTTNPLGGDVATFWSACWPGAPAWSR